MLFNFLYAFALFIASPLILYRRVRHDRYRRGWRQKLFGLSAAEATRLTGGKRCIWLHAVSVGEVNLLKGLVSKLSDHYESASIVVSTSTDTGYDVAVKQFGADRVFYCPLDFTWAVSRTIRNLSPRLLVLAELELWPNLIRTADRMGSPVMVINARLSDASASRYCQFGLLTRNTFALLHRVECQDESTAANFARCGTPEKRIGVSGSIKFDNAPTGRDHPEVHARAAWAGIDPWQVVWMVGSTQEGEEAMALRIYNRLKERFSELRLTIVPRHPERFDRVAREIESAALISHRRSCDGSQQQTSWSADRVLLIDSIGELRHWWGVCHLATVGGSFGDRGGQNMLEPAGYGCTVSFGPNTKNFRQIAGALLRADAAVCVDDEADLERFVETCLTNVPWADALGRNARAMVAAHRGATERTISAIQMVLPLVGRRAAA